MVDYLIVGCGLAGMAMAETLRKRGRSLRVFDDASQRASRVAAGLYNPVVLKRLRLCWQGNALMQESLPFYDALQQRLGIRVDTKIPVLRRLVSAEEQNAWFEAADRPGLDRYLSTKLLRNTNEALDAPYGYGEVLHTGKLHTANLLNAFIDDLHGSGQLMAEAFDPRALVPEGEGFRYGNLQARRVVFCEGFGLRGNPYFNYLPLQGTKGELLVIRAPELREERVIKAGIFIMPAGKDRYRIGATYTWNDYSQEPTEAARRELLDQLGRMLRCDYEVEGQVAGIRPTVPDRRPLAGAHPVTPGLYVLNGMGSRGVLLAPYAASCLAAMMEDGAALPPEMDIARYSGHFGKKPGQG